MWGLLSPCFGGRIEILTKVGACRTSIEDDGEVIDAAKPFLSSWYVSVSQKRRRGSRWQFPSHCAEVSQESDGAFPPRTVKICPGLTLALALT
jgi:hypothetical protein